MRRQILTTLERSGRRKAIAARFWEKVNRRGHDDCWPWTGATGSKGYGRFKIVSYVTIHAHRIAYALRYGIEPGDLLVCHHCDNPPCCNPAHLFLGTVQDNSNDMVRKGRWRGPDSSGENNPRAVLTEIQVAEIKRLIARKKTNIEIGQMFGVHHATISAIRRGKIWRKVGTEVGTAKSA